METFKTVPDKDLLYYTLLQMQRLELQAAADPRFLEFIKYTFLPENYNLNLYVKIFNYCKKYFVYEKDNIYKNDDELLIYPVVMLSRKKGDCDDYAIFIKAILRALNIKSNYLLLGKDPDNITHVAVESLGFVIDPTVPAFNTIDFQRYKFAAVVTQIDKKIIINKITKRQCNG